MALDTERGGIAVISREPIHEQILPYIRKGIVENRWKPGTRLPEPLLCREFGISRTPLRMAFRALEAEGLIEIVPNVGAVVTAPARADVVETMEAICAIEQWAAHKVAKTRQAAAVDEIVRLHRQMCRAATAGDSNAYYSINDDFHRAIVLGSGNSRLAQIHKTLMWHIDRERHRVNEREPLSPTAADHHADVVDKIITGEAEAAGAAMRDHLEFVTRILLKHRRHEIESQET